MATRQEIIAAWQYQKRLGRKVISSDQLQKYLNAMGTGANFAVTPDQLLEALHGANFEQDETFTAAGAEIVNSSGRHLPIEAVVLGDAMARAYDTEAPTPSAAGYRPDFSKSDIEQAQGELQNITGKSYSTGEVKAADIWAQLVSGFPSTQKAPDSHPEIQPHETHRRLMRGQPAWAQNGSFAAVSPFDAIADICTAAASPVDTETTYEDFDTKLDPAPTRPDSFLLLL